MVCCSICRKMSVSVALSALTVTLGVDCPYMTAGHSKDRISTENNLILMFLHMLF